MLECMLPKEVVSNADKLKIQTERIFSGIPGVDELRQRKSAIEQEKMMVEFALYQAKDAIEALSSKVSVWEIQQKREIAFTEERTVERQYDIQRFKLNNLS